ncbi:MAG: 4-hydroxy-tetrahydrodipicolinate synthase [Xanthomonadaceae bacterium]|nr:4-hydroxy-tetrahydrodipicolinate synthase [Xanthomonadaceae bacterium]
MHLSGIITALATPFTETGALDLDAWRELLVWQLQSGVQGIVVAGSTGEAAMLDDDEYTHLLRIAVDVMAKRVPVLAGTGMSGTAKTIAQTRRAADAGADAALVVTPPYVRPTQEGLMAHYRAVAEEGGLPIMLYNVPGRTGCDLLPETVAALAGEDRVIGVKEARNDPERMQALVPLRRAGFSVFSGDDATALRALLAGADGVISVASNAMPACFRRLYDLVQAGREDAALAWNTRLEPFYDFCGIEPNPIPVKALMQRVGYGRQELRLPLLPLSTVHRPEADRLAAEVRALEKQCHDETISAG